MKEITISKDIIKKYDTNDVIHFLDVSYKRYLKQMDEGMSENDIGKVGASWANMMHITNILDELDAKLNKKSDVNMI